MLIEKDTSCLLLVDVQEKLTPLVQNHQKLIQNCEWLLFAAKELAVPIIVSEQYPKGLGHTVTSLKTFITKPHLEKTHFSCASDTACLQEINQTNAKQIIIIGIESHVCVLQTAIELQMRDKQVFVVADAVSSRNKMDYEMALERMRALGIQIVTKEMVVFEWLHQAGTEKFKSLSKALFKS